MDGPSPDALLLQQNAGLGSKGIFWLITQKTISFPEFLRWNS